MRRLPVFFVLDCSESMIGENLKKMTDGLQMIVGDLRKDPHALETAWVSVIAFAGVARTIVLMRLKATGNPSCISLPTDVRLTTQPQK